MERESGGRTRLENKLAMKVEQFDKLNNTIIAKSREIDEMTSEVEKLRTNLQEIKAEIREIKSVLRTM